MLADGSSAKSAKTAPQGSCSSEKAPTPGIGTLSIIAVAPSFFAFSVAVASSGAKE